MTAPMRFLIIGLDDFGSWLARELGAAGHRVVAVDARGDRIDAYREWVSRGVVADATRVDVLEQIGAARMDAVVVSAGEGVSSRLLTAIALHNLGVRTLIVEAERGEVALALEMIGVGHVVHPAREAAHRLARRLPAMVAEQAAGS